MNGMSTNLRASLRLHPSGPYGIPTDLELEAKISLDGISQWSSKLIPVNRQGVGGWEIRCFDVPIPFAALSRGLVTSRYFKTTNEPLAVEPVELQRAFLIAISEASNEHKLTFLAEARLQAGQVMDSPTPGVSPTISLGQLRFFRRPSKRWVTLLNKIIADTMKSKISGKDGEFSWPKREPSAMEYYKRAMATVAQIKRASARRP